MKSTQQRKHLRKPPDEILPEYRFDYRKSRPNRFAGRYEEGGLVVVLEPDVSEVFPSAQAVNKALRALISAMPEQSKGKRAKR